jgi:hypothetical protein
LAYLVFSAGMALSGLTTIDKIKNKWETTKKGHLQSVCYFG